VGVCEIVDGTQGLARAKPCFIIELHWTTEAGGTLFPIWNVRQGIGTVFNEQGKKSNVCSPQLMTLRRSEKSLD
jgi:hypothetical protein